MTLSYQGTQDNPLNLTSLFATRDDSQVPGIGHGCVKAIFQPTLGKFPQAEG